LVAVMTIDELLQLARKVGLKLRSIESEDSANLYLWATPEREVLYVGKSVSPKRISDERKFAKSDPTAETVSAFIALVRRNQGVCHPLLIEGFDPTPSQALLLKDDWGGHAVDVLQTWLDKSEGSISTELAEKLLIRIVVRAGVPVGNSRDASQWENPIGSPMDTLAVLATIPLLGSRTPTAVAS
jgi:hypothetical protein